MTTIAELAGEAYGHFETRERGDEKIIALKDGAPQWVRDLVRKAHGDFLPDDWRYASIRSALGAIHDADATDEDALDDLSAEWADGNVDVYNAARTAWLASNLNRAAYCDDAAAEFGGDDRNVMDLIGLGQYMESSEVFASVAGSLRERLEELELEAGEVER